MTTYGFVSVHEYVNGPRESDRFLKFGKGDASGSDIIIPTPDNDVDTMTSADRTRVLVHQLPQYPDERLTKDEVKSYLEDERPERVWDALESDDAE